MGINNSAWQAYAATERVGPPLRLDPLVCKTSEDHKVDKKVAPRAWPMEDAQNLGGRERASQIAPAKRLGGLQAYEKAVSNSRGIDNRLGSKLPIGDAPSTLCVDAESHRLPAPAPASAIKHE